MENPHFERRLVQKRHEWKRGREPLDSQKPFARGDTERKINTETAEEREEHREERNFVKEQTDVLSPYIHLSLCPLIPLRLCVVLFMSGLCCSFLEQTVLFFS
jgi:hypothetical protein